MDKFQSRKAKQKERRQKAKARKKLLLNNKDKVIQTLATKSKSSSSVIKAPAVIVYEDPRKRKRKREAEAANQEEPSRPRLDKSLVDGDEVSMKQARFDVFKFGLKGFGKAAKEDAEIAQLIRLGAKPAKKKCIPYAELKEQRRKEKEEEKERKEIQRLSGIKSKSLISRKSANKKGGGDSKTKKKKSSGGTESIGKVGKFDGGMLKLSAKDLAKIRGGK